MDFGPSSPRLDETAIKTRMRFVDIVRIASVGLLGAASPWIVWTLISACLLVLGYSWDPVRQFPPAMISVPASVICGVLHAVAEMRSLQRRSHATDSAIEDSACEYFDSHCAEHLWPEHLELISKNPEQHLQIRFGEARSSDWESTVGSAINESQFREAQFWVKGDGHPERLARFLVAVKKPWQSSRVIYPVWYPDANIDTSAE
jgi:hypothetical protein